MLRVCFILYLTTLVCGLPHHDPANPHHHHHHEEPINFPANQRDIRGEVQGRSQGQGQGQGQTCTESPMHFSWSLLGSILKEKPQENLFFSPASIKLVLGMLHEGAQGNSAKVIRSALMCSEKCSCNLSEQMSSAVNELDTKDLQNLTISSANRIYVDQKVQLNPTYQTELTNTYQAEALAADFENNAETERVDINSWVENKTEGLIKDLFDSSSITSDTIMAIVNALYFKASWDLAFDKSKTAEGDFTTLNGDVIKTQFMSQKADFPYTVSNELQAHIVSLPYQDDGNQSQTSFNILLPMQEGLDAYNQMETTLINEPMHLMEAEENMWEREIKLKLPSFKMEFEQDLETTMTEMGMGELFGNSANLGGMLKDVGPVLKISSAIHKAYVKVDEEGTEAAAATGFGISLLSFPAPVVEINCNRPFLFYIKRNEEVIFMGKFAKPSSEQAQI